MGRGHQTSGFFAIYISVDKVAGDIPNFLRGQSDGIEALVVVAHLLGNNVLPPATIQAVGRS